MGDSLPAYLVRFTSKIEDKSWDAASWSSDFVWIDAGDPAPLRSRFKALYDLSALHFRFEYESIKVSDKHLQPLDPDFPRACEVFLDPQGRGRPYLEYAVAPDGQQHAITWDGRLSMRKWEGERGIESTATVTRGPHATSDESRETIIYQVRFPWTALKKLAGNHSVPPARGDAWRANFSRVEPEGQFGGDFSWTPAGEYYMHHPNTFGWLVFAGERDPLTQAPAETLKPLPDAMFDEPVGKQFVPFSDVLWTRFPLIRAPSGDFLTVTKTSVVRLQANGAARWKLTRKDGLPQFIRSVALVGENLYVYGDGIGAGSCTIDREARIVRLTNVAPSARLVSLDAAHAAAFVTDQVQLIDNTGVHAQVRTEGEVRCAAAMSNGRLIALGTSSGFALIGGDSKMICHTSIAGGIIAAAPVGDGVVGASGKNGLFLLRPDGSCSYYPSPQRTKFDGVFADARTDRCWATYTGGLAEISGRDADITYHDEPARVAGCRISDAAFAADGRAVFAGHVPNGNWYRSSQDSPFLLVRDSARWDKISFAEGLPAQITAVTAIDGEIFVSTNRGIYRLQRQ